jgi:hypothetical protein
MRKKSKKRHKKQHHKAAVQTFSQFVEDANDRVIGRSPSILPVMEGLLKDALPFRYASEPQHKNSDIDEINFEWTDETDFAEEPLISKIQALHDKYSRLISIPWYAIPLSVIPILILTIIVLQSNAFKPGMINSIQPKTHLATDSQFAREMESAATERQLSFHLSTTIR